MLQPVTLHQIPMETESQNGQNIRMPFSAAVRNTGIYQIKVGCFSLLCKGSRAS